ncbi:hypothetical protein VRRI112168_00285 [Vreelandella rituensis]|uniref:Uncharacterized protein n=1 Tax=Vreelandella rituensis TaxID=2282306 RepID=A0A368UA55_9GAMM|nr:hypothetical protein [Halomonas rituensis]RCV93864.1 hypothetical protein DU506_01520 [Halomonas rituensis]
MDQRIPPALLSPAATADCPLHRAGLDFARAFLRGEIAPFAEPLEHSDSFSDALNSPEGNDLESCIMGLAHGDCHSLTAALADRLDVENVVMIRTAGGGAPVHSGLHHPERGLLLDANGVHRVEDACRFWSVIGGEPCKAVPTTTDGFCSNYDEEDADYALSHFAIIAAFVTPRLAKLTASERAAPPGRKAVSGPTLG